MTDTNTALEPCPFCGGEAEIERRGDMRCSMIYACTDCGCYLETGEIGNDHRRWNTRAAPSTPPVAWLIDDLILPHRSVTLDGTWAELKRIHVYEGEPVCTVTPLYTRPQPDRVSELEAALEDARQVIGKVIGNYGGVLCRIKTALKGGA